MYTTTALNKKLYDKQRNNGIVMGKQSKQSVIEQESLEMFLENCK